MELLGVCFWDMEISFFILFFFIFKLPISTVITHYYTFLFHLSFLVYDFFGVDTL